MAGEVFAGSERIDKPGQLVAGDTSLRVRSRAAYVSRGGDKLAGALDGFAVAVAGAVCLDAGCSTGGFTDCLLQRGAERVYSVDVGYGQLAWQLRGDPRVVVMERTNVRTLAAGDLEPAPTLVVADLSFIRLRTVLPTLAAVAAPGARMIVLVKPQFELARADVAGGVVDDPALHVRAVGLVEDAATRLGLEARSSVESPLRGPQGNREFFLDLRVPA